MQKKKLLILLSVLVIYSALYGGFRLWFHFTDGFLIAHISSDFKPDPRWEIRNLRSEEKLELDAALSQSYSYIGKGCQSYVFESKDGNYVLKFLKYQRFRPQFQNYLFAFFREYKDYLELKIDHKNKKRDRLFTSMTTAFDLLPKETALIYMHLNKSDHLNKKVLIRDKMGIEHQLEMDRMEFMIQKKGEMLCSVIDRMMAEGRDEETKEMLSNLFQMILGEYQRGLPDKDNALIQNTGVINGKAFQLDVGGFVADPLASNPEVYHQEIFNKYYKFRLWLENNHPSLLEHVNNELIEELGEKFYVIQYIPSV